MREAKALVPSAWDWAQDSISRHSRFLDLARGTFRAPDPFLDVRDRFIVRRIAADSQKSELGDDPSVSTVLLGAMAADLAAIHAADSGIADLHAHLAGLPADWLHDAARKAKQSVEADYAKWTS